MRTARTLRRQSDLGYSPGLIAALATIDRGGPITPSDFAAHEGVRRPTATALIARLEEEALVKRTRDPLDGRSCQVQTTPAGRALLKQTRGRKNAFLERGLEDLAVEDLATLERAAELLDRMLQERA